MRFQVFLVAKIISREAKNETADVSVPLVCGEGMCRSDNLEEDFRRYHGTAAHSEKISDALLRNLPAFCWKPFGGALWTTGKTPIKALEAARYRVAGNQVAVSLSGLCPSKRKDSATLWIFLRLKSKKYLDLRHVERVVAIRTCSKIVLVHNAIGHIQEPLAIRIHKRSICTLQFWLRPHTSNPSLPFTNTSCVKSQKRPKIKALGSKNRKPKATRGSGIGVTGFRVHLAFCIIVTLTKTFRSVCIYVADLICVTIRLHCSITLFGANACLALGVVARVARFCYLDLVRTNNEIVERSDDRATGLNKAHANRNRLLKIRLKSATWKLYTTNSQFGNWWFHMSVHL